MWQILNSEIVYQGRLKVVRDYLITPTGDKADWTYVALNGAAAVLAFTEAGQVVLTRQYRHPLLEYALHLTVEAKNRDRRDGRMDKVKRLIRERSAEFILRSVGQRNSEG